MRQPDQTQAPGPSPKPLSLALICLAMALALSGCATTHLAGVTRHPEQAPAIFFAGIDVFDGENLIQNQDVLVNGSRIEWIKPAGTDTPHGLALRFEGAGRTLMPGLIDAHVHMNSLGGAPWKLRLPDPEASARAFLYAGVTSILLGNSGKAEMALQQEAALGKRLAPRLYLPGPGITAPEGHPIPLMKALIPWPLSNRVASMIPTASTPEEARAQVRQIHDQMAPAFLKLFFDAIPPGTPHTTREVLVAAVDEAKKLGMRPIAHIGTAEDMVTAAEAGVEILMHCAAGDRLSEAQIQRLIALQVPFVPTIRAYSSVTDMTSGNITDFEREMVEAKAFDVINKRPKNYGKGWVQAYEKTLPTLTENIRANTKALIDAGLPFIVGTDTSLPGLFPGAGLHTELAVLVDMGVPTLEVLRAATSRSARILEPKRKFGRIEAGYDADLILIRGNPIEDIQAVDAIDEVFLGGLRLKRLPPGAAQPY